jgi:acyl-homoserine-lactone acylase
MAQQAQMTTANRANRAAAWLLPLAVAAGCLPPRPQLSPESLARDALIRRDRFGVPHILATSEEAAAYAFGYAQAEDHSELIIRRLIAARGEEAKYFGASGIENDFAMARLDNLAESRRGLSEVGPTFRRTLAAYAAGINAYALIRAPFPGVPVFDAADVMASLRAPAATVVPGPGLVRRLRAKYEGREQDAPLLLDEDPGSNAVALAGSKTTTGKPLLLGNPHLDWSSLYWEAHVTVPGVVNFYGSTLAGLPVLRAGFNDRVGFVQTNNAPDLDDVYRLPIDPTEPGAYTFEGRRHTMTPRDVSIEIRSADGATRTETRRFWSSHLGPVVHRTATDAFAVRSIRLDAWHYFEGFQLAAKARSLDGFLGVMRRLYIPTSNFMYADADGNILYLWNARLPRRLDEGTSYDLDVPGLAKYLWRGLHELHDLPQSLNPPGGYVQNANNPPRYVSGADPIDMETRPSYVERGALGLRPQLALRLLGERAKYSPDDLIALKFETRMLLADRVKPALIDALRAGRSLDPDAQAGLATLEAWDGRVAATSRGAALFIRFWDTYAAEVRQPFAVPFDDRKPLDTPAGLSNPASAIAHLVEAVRWMRETHGSERAAWGELNRYQLGEVDLPGEGCPGAYGCYRVQRFVPESTERGMIGVAGNLPGRGTVGFGDAWVLLADFSTTPPTASSLLAYGQTSNLSSPHSRDQIALLAARRLRRVYFTEADIAANLEREYRPRCGAPCGF